MSKKTILVTGASGFVGHALVQSLCKNEYDVRATVRSESGAASIRAMPLTNKPTVYNLGELNETTDWDEALQSCDTVIHCAARAHVLKEISSNPYDIYRQINSRVTEHLAMEAHRHGVRRFIFLSSVGVLGHNSGDTPFNDDSPPNPESPYATAKWEAEQCLLGCLMLDKEAIVKVVDFIKYIPSLNSITSVLGSIFNVFISSILFKIFSTFLKFSFIKK